MSGTSEDVGVALAADGPAAGRLTADDFSAAVAPHVRRIDPTDYDDVYVVGDVHGCRAELETLLDRLDLGDDDLVVFVGDLVRKGPDSHGVVDLVRSLPNAVSVRGNNEDKLIHGRKDLPAVTDPFDDYLDAMPVALLLGDAMVVHGGVDPRRALDEHDIEDLLNFRSVPPEAGYDGPFWWEEYEGPTRVFFGHTVLDEPVVSEHAVGLDTGCVYGGALTAYDLKGDRVVAVPAEREYQPRADRKIIEPPAPYRG
ncbi:metallophosphoesterase family protein [Halosegnis marinus]|uniref:Metallophosphoesterase family protein n=1 Tax=Halosegnis marinus TaxID=3034023 RepID=A0ABD5ZLR0_9EURY|nr:metallophosphoesterase family protein [Halosegnis sp. DT85]